MKLRNKLRHMANGSVNVDGNVYEIDKDGYATVDNEADSAKLLDNYQAWVEVHEDIDTDTDTDTDTDDKVIDKTDSETKKSNDYNDTESETPITKTDTDADTDTEVDTDTDADVDVDDIPDPSEEMSPKQLRELADTYQVPYNKRTSKTVLIERITKAMYPED